MFQPPTIRTVQRAPQIPQDGAVEDLKLLRSDVDKSDMVNKIISRQ